MTGQNYDEQAEWGARVVRMQEAGLSLHMEQPLGVVPAAWAKPFLFRFNGDWPRGR